MSEKTHAQEAKSQERNHQMEAQLELLRNAVAELRMGAQARGGRNIGAPSAAGSSPISRGAARAVGRVSM